MSSPIPASSRMVYGFRRQLTLGQKGELELDGFFRRRGYEIEPVPLSEQLRGIDRVFTITGASFNVEYKTDYKAKDTGNVYVETYGEIWYDNSRAPKKGWGKAGHSDYIVIYAPGAFLAWVKTKTLHDTVPEWDGKFKSRPCYNSTYNSLGILVPIAEIRAIAVHSIELQGTIEEVP